eukprot:4075098-Pleurochrysis_carterae.AAC.1
MALQTELFFIPSARTAGSYAIHVKDASGDGFCALDDCGFRAFFAFFIGDEPVFLVGPDLSPFTSLRVFTFDLPYGDTPGEGSPSPPPPPSPSPRPVRRAFLHRPLRRVLLHRP